MQSFYPFGDRVVIKPDPAVEQTSGGIYLPEDQREDAEHHSGRVIYVGPGKVESGLRVTMESKPGMHVRYYKFRAVPLELDGEEHVIVTEVDILGCLPE